MRVLSVVGARPQFVKAAVLSAELERRGVEEMLVHTGQHYDATMSDVFFDELSLPKPAYELGVGSGPHGAQTGEMMRRLEPIAFEEAPDWTIVYGDTNSTLAGALVGAKLGIPVAHVEAGLRSFDRSMPEEINRIVADHVASLLLVPNERAARQLAVEGIERGVSIVGDLMVDLVRSAGKSLPERPAILERLQLQPYAYAVATIHRAGNTNDRERFGRIVEGLRRVEMPVVFPVHPRTLAIAREFGVGEGDNIVVIDPLPYSEITALLARARVLLTDSGGMQKEAYVLRVPCVTLRDQTEWVETLDDGWNVLAGSDPSAIAAAARRERPSRQTSHYGAGAAKAIVDALEQGVETPGEGAGKVTRVGNGSRGDLQLTIAGDEASIGLA